MNLTPGEKLTLFMLSEIYEHLEIKGEVDPKFIKSAIANGKLFGLEWDYAGILHGEDTPKSVVRETADIMTMWSVLEAHYGRLDSTEKAHVDASIPSYEHVVFAGFDGNDGAGHYGVAKFLVEDMRRFSEFVGRSLNSHSNTIDGDREKLKVYQDRVRGARGNFSVDDIIAVMNAR